MSMTGRKEDGNIDDDVHCGCVTTKNYNVDDHNNDDDDDDDEYHIHHHAVADNKRVKR